MTHTTAPITSPQAADTNPDVIIIGGGVIGCWTAHFLLQRGCRVTLIERDRIGAGASGGNCGYHSPSHVMPLCVPGAIGHSLPQLLSRRGALSIPLRFDPTLWKWLARFATNCNRAQQQHAARARNSLLQTSIAMYREYVAKTGIEVQWQDRGLTVVHRTARTFDGYQAMAEELRRDFEIEVDPLDEAALLKFEPSLVEGLAGAWHFPADAHMHPLVFMQELRKNIERDGARVLESTEVHEIAVENQRVQYVETSQGRMQAQQYVLATGAEAPRFAKPLGCQIPIIPGKGYSMNFPASAGGPQHPMIFADSHVAVTPLGSQLRVGSTMQLTGYNRNVDAGRVKMIRDDAQSYLRVKLPSEAKDAWTGWRPMVHDDLPCIDRAPAAGNAYVAAGNGMLGLSTAPATARLVAELMGGETPHIDPAPFSLARF